MVASARGDLADDALDAALASEERDAVRPLPAQFLVLANPVMTRYEAKNNLHSRPERGDGSRPGVQEAATRIFDVVTGGDTTELDAWARGIVVR